MSGYQPRSDAEIARDAARLIKKAQELDMALHEDDVVEIIARAIYEAKSAKA